jgi:hypothetical protein
MTRAWIVGGIAGACVGAVVWVVGLGVSLWGAFALSRSVYLLGEAVRQPGTAIAGLVDAPASGSAILSAAVDVGLYAGLGALAMRLRQRGAA